MEREQKADSGPRRLPVVRINGVGYFLDGRLKQLRAVCNPHDWIDFESDDLGPWIVGLVQDQHEE